jgi:hypothetical protein
MSDAERPSAATRKFRFDREGLGLEITCQPGEQP